MGASESRNLGLSDLSLHTHARTHIHIHIHTHTHTNTYTNTHFHPSIHLDKHNCCITDTLKNQCKLAVPIDSFCWWQYMVPDWNMAIRSKHGFPPHDPKERPHHTFGSPKGLMKQKKGGKFALSFTSPDFWKKKILLWSDCEAKKIINAPLITTYTCTCIDIHAILEYECVEYRYRFVHIQVCSIHLYAYITCVYT